jgi:predicted GIY-YIG superfamily endonuclease
LKVSQENTVFTDWSITSYTAITREKQIKKWNRAWKLDLIEEQNPDWEDLWERII